MNNDYNLEFCFKGKRNYVHGTDIYNKVIKNLDKNQIIYSNIDFSFHGVSQENLRISKIKPLDEKNLKFVYKYKNKNNQQEVFYATQDNSSIDCRYEYDEESISTLSQMDIEKQEINLSVPTSYTFIENVVANNKFLLEQLFPQADGKWYFTRLQLHEKIDENNIYPLRLLFKNNFNFKLTKTEISLNDKLVGFIYFSLV
ncbi:MAG: hypothetical protein JKX75_00790 [Gammaproteobacteria bacterium]|nr:hypothetical protein [Gammaproteobacteria bacterium]